MAKSITASKSVKSKARPKAKNSISEDIAQLIIDSISTGHLKPGQRLPSERELCKDFGASRSSLREALRCLSIVGILSARVGDGTSVSEDGGKFLEKIIEWRTLTEKHDIENLMEVRMGLESVAAANLATRGNSADIAKLETLVKGMSMLVTDEKRFRALDLEFHVTIAKASGNALLFDLVSLIRGQLVKGLSRVLLLPDALPLSHKEHANILRAIKGRDAKGASDAMHTHLSKALNRYHERGRKHGHPVLRSGPDK